ncbi:hypothetical protein ALQ33_200196 [Pseudomonas syringae pv. philadelphi]|uniref:Uncharacterized protein n=1 Tax=Pseudomonas syringae pv. philadelphi TaxID=251706 RepID=A0A3M3YCT7_9PSED|nr:hypothetical protein [Pseudomonas syringae group genomosp. 3]RMO79775.1 hypothetical protein ALQ33_200196 [Pseudomonas syringae pv. philadelphi]
MSFRPLNNVSDLFFAIGDAIHAAGMGVNVANYEEFDGEVGDATVLIEIERTGPAIRGNDGRYAHLVTVTLHAVVSRFRKYAVLEAMNLSTCLERLADCNRWGFRGIQCQHPEDMHSGPSIFREGQGGYEAWGCTFKQKLAPGPDKVPEDPVMLQPGMPKVAETWRVDDIDDPEKYEKLVP